MSNLIIKIENLSKQYKIGKKFDNTLYDNINSKINSFGNVFRSKKTKKREEKSDYIWALKDISLNIKEGDVVGIIGKNGSGKSTLLKLISNISFPTSGKIRLKGRVGSLLEVGMGFHRELTGRDNIFLYGAILGMMRKEIMQKFDSIVNFSEVEDFLDTPIKYYSSGMNVRLAFSVASHLETEILILDEVLAVGDINFQKKCIKKIKEIACSGRTILFVSHSIDNLQKICSKSIFLEKGQLIDYSSTEKIKEKYLKFIEF
jgi:lipopolysaccharide transport system ATP-binding protein